MKQIFSLFCTFLIVINSISSLNASGREEINKYIYGDDYLKLKNGVLSKYQLDYEQKEEILAQSSPLKNSLEEITGKYDFNIFEKFIDHIAKLVSSKAYTATSSASMIRASIIGDPQIIISETKKHSPKSYKQIDELGKQILIPEKRIKATNSLLEILPFEGKKIEPIVKKEDKLNIPSEDKQDSDKNFAYLIYTFIGIGIASFIGMEVARQLSKP